MSDPRPRLVVLVGLPASGKSTWAARHGIAALSSDQVRWLLVDDATDQTVHRPVFATVRYLLRRRLEMQRPISCIDATNLTVRERRPYIKLAQLYDARPEAVYFDTPVEVCRERNRMRDRVVPDEAIDQMLLRLQPPSLEEGFESVTVIRPE